MDPIHIRGRSSTLAHPRADEQPDHSGAPETTLLPLPKCSGYRSAEWRTSRN